MCVVPKIDRLLATADSYLTGTPREHAPNVPIPLHTVVKLTPQVYTCTEERFPLSSLAPQDGSDAAAVPEGGGAPGTTGAGADDVFAMELNADEMNAPSC